MTISLSGTGSASSSSSSSSRTHHRGRTTTRLDHHGRRVLAALPATATFAGGRRRATRPRRVTDHPTLTRLRAGYGPGGQHGDPHGHGLQPAPPRSAFDGRAAVLPGRERHPGQDHRAGRREERPHHGHHLGRHGHQRHSLHGHAQAGAHNPRRARRRPAAPAAAAACGSSSRSPAAQRHRDLERHRFDDLEQLLDLDTSSTSGVVTGIALAAGATPRTLAAPAHDLGQAHLRLRERRRRSTRPSPRASPRAPRGRTWRPCSGRSRRRATSPARSTATSARPPRPRSKTGRRPTA